MNMRQAIAQQAGAIPHRGHAHFWLRALTRRRLIKAGAGMTATDLVINDYHDFFNAIGQATPPIPVVTGTVSFAVNWTGTGKPTRLHDAANGFAGLFIDSTARIAWSAREPANNFQFVSDPASTSTAVSGVIGKELNGVFFKQNWRRR